MALVGARSDEEGSLLLLFRVRRGIEKRGEIERETKRMEKSKDRSAETERDDRRAGKGYAGWDGSNNLYPQDDSFANDPVARSKTSNAAPDFDDGTGDVLPQYAGHGHVWEQVVAHDLLVHVDWIDRHCCGLDE